MDQVSVLGNIDEEHITKFLGVASEVLIKDFLTLIQTGDAKALFEKIDDIHISRTTGERNKGTNVI